MSRTSVIIAEQAANQMDSSNDYLNFLETFPLKLSPSGYYWLHGQIEQTQGWIIHLSIIQTQFLSLLEIIIPYLLNSNTPFKLPRDMDTLSRINDGALGYINVGKAICIYPNLTAALPMAKALVTLTNSFRSPAIPTDRYLGSAVYTRYGSFDPIMVKDQQGLPIKHIYNANGQLIPDQYTIPFKMPAGLEWPFVSLAPVTSESSKLISFRFYPLQTLKQDAKGNVIKALYFKKFYQIRTCLIKEAKKDMFSDQEGRDIRDRLKWQYDLHMHLLGHIPLPNIIGYFAESQDHYLAMEYIKGISLNKWIENIFKGRMWRNLPTSDQRLLLTKMLSIVGMVENLHKEGYIHRDITPENFLIDEKGSLTMIDLELTWSSISCFPNPPFKWGTPGFMSPEQLDCIQPTIKEDIYALGSLMIVLMTGLHPLKLNTYFTPSLERSLLFFLNDPALSQIIYSCLQSDPHARPSLSSIKEKVEAKIDSLSSSETPRNGSEVDIPPLINASIRGLCYKMFLSENKLWVSRKKTNENYIKNEQEELALYKGWHTGIAGILWVVARAKGLGHDIDSCKMEYHCNWQYIEKTFFTNQASYRQPGLYSGAAGIALAIAEGLNSRLIPQESKYIQYISQCFSDKIHIGGLSTGIPGQGIALLSCSNWIDNRLFTDLLQEYLTITMEAQQNNGSWQLISPSTRKGDIYIGLSEGVSGIILFLLASLTFNADKKVEETVQKGLSWLQSVSIKRKGVQCWTISSKTDTIEKLSVSKGILGIILTYIKAYEIFRIPVHRAIAENWLLSIPENLVQADFSQESGLSGLGELYLEAYNIFKEPVWLKRAQWIAQFFENTIQYPKKGQGFWQVTSSLQATTDLFSGNSGIIHFLLRLSNPPKLSHPLWISTKRI